MCTTTSEYSCRISCRGGDDDEMRMRQTPTNTLDHSRPRTLTSDQHSSSNLAFGCRVIESAIIHPCQLVRLRSSDLSDRLRATLALPSIAYLESDAIILTIPLSTNLWTTPALRFFLVCLLCGVNDCPFFFPRSDAALDKQNRLMCTRAVKQEPR